MRTSRTVAGLAGRVLGPDVPVRIHSYDGSDIGPPQAPSTIVIRSPDALRRLVTAPGELGIGRAYVAGELDVEGDLSWALATLQQHPVHRSPAAAADLARLLGRN